MFNDETPVNAYNVDKRKGYCHCRMSLVNLFRYFTSLNQFEWLFQKFCLIKCGKL